MMHEYAFDVSLYAVVRVMAADEVSAREAMTDVLDACDVSSHFLDGYNSGRVGVKVTEASLSQNTTPKLFEVDEEPV